MEENDCEKIETKPNSIKQVRKILGLVLERSHAGDREGDRFNR